MKYESKNKPLASLSLDLDNQWSYMKVHGDSGWQVYPSYFDIVVPRFLTLFKELGLTVTVFVVGQDAALSKNHNALASIPQAGHEIGNHSFNHESWLHLYTRADLETELARAEEHIVNATGKRPDGFRGPGYSLSRNTLDVLMHSGYLYDASTLPTFIGPLARSYYFMTTRLSHEEKEKRNLLFGSLRDGLRPIRPYRWKIGDSTILEIPVTTLPFLRVPFHLSYIIYISTFSEPLARAYWRSALRTCRLLGVEPSILLHPLDFLGKDDLKTLSFFPGMNLLAEDKLERVRMYLSDFVRQFRVLPIGSYADIVLQRSRVPVRPPVFHHGALVTPPVRQFVHDQALLK